MKETLSETIIENHDEKMKAKLKVSQLENELKTVALEWKSSRNIEECGCSTTFDAFNKKVYLAKLTRTIIYNLNHSFFVFAMILF